MLSRVLGVCGTGNCDSKIIILKKEKQSQAEAGEETTVVVREASGGPQSCLPCCWRCAAYRLSE